MRLRGLRGRNRGTQTVASHRGGSKLFGSTRILPRIAAGEIRTGGAAVRYKQRVIGKNGVAHEMHHTRGRVAGGVQGGAGHRADMIGVAIGKQCVKLRTAPLKLGTLVEHFAKGFSHSCDLRADPDFAAQTLLQIRCAA